MDRDQQKSRARRLCLAFIGLALALVVPLRGWTAVTPAPIPEPPADEARTCPATQDRDALAYLSGRDDVAAAALIGFPCASKTCLICEENGGNCAPIDGHPGRCTCD